MTDNVIYFGSEPLELSLIYTTPNTTTLMLQSREGQGHNKDVTADVGQALCQAFVAYDDGDFASAVELLLPIRYKVITIGGSHAQVSLFKCLFYLVGYLVLISFILFFFFFLSDGFIGPINNEVCQIFSASLKTITFQMVIDF